MLSDAGVCGVSECPERPIFTFFIKENWICAETRHHAEPNINTLLTRIFLVTLTSDSEAILWWYHCRLIWTMEHVVNLNVTWLGFFFCFDFVRSNSRCSCCSIVCLRFQIVHMKQVDCEMSLKMGIVTNKGNFVIHFGNSTHKIIKPQKKEVRFQLNENKLKES